MILRSIDLTNLLLNFFLKLIILFVLIILKSIIFNSLYFSFQFVLMLYLLSIIIYNLQLNHAIHWYSFHGKFIRWVIFLDLARDYLFLIIHHLSIIFHINFPPLIYLYIDFYYLFLHLVLIYVSLKMYNQSEVIHIFFMLILVHFKLIIFHHQKHLQFIILIYFIFPQILLQVISFI